MKEEIKLLESVNNMIEQKINKEKNAIKKLKMCAAQISIEVTIIRLKKLEK